MDPIGFAVVSIVRSAMPVVGIAVFGWTIVMFTRARHGKGGGAVPLPPATLRPLAERLERLEQVTEAISLQVERIAEGQRFVTKLLAEPDQVQPRIGK
jgi:hypothetical protein